MHPLKGLILIFKEWYHQLPLKGTALWLRCQLPSLHSCPLKQIVFLALKWEFTLSLGQEPPAPPWTVSWHPGRVESEGSWALSL